MVWLWGSLSYVSTVVFLEIRGWIMLEVFLLSYEKIMLCLHGVVVAIEIYFHKNWNKRWFDTYSLLVVKASSNANLISCKIKTRWLNYLVTSHTFDFTITYILREDHVCVDSLVKIDFYNISYS